MELVHIKFLLYLTLTAFLPTLTFSTFILTSPPVTSFGSWGAWTDCPPDTFLRSLAVSSDQGSPSTPPPVPDGPDTQDNSGLTSFSPPSCVDPYEPFPTAPDTEITCEGLVTGFQLKSYSAQLALDNLGATSIRLYCSGLKGAPTGYVEDWKGDNLGTWTQPQHCNTRQAVCGFRVQDATGTSDASGINNVQFRCCDIPPPTAKCDATDGWELVQECDNVNGTSQISCRNRRHVGVGVLTALAPDGYKANDIYRHISYGFDPLDKTSPPFWLYDELSLKFGNKGVSNTTGFDWSEANYEIWNPIRASDSDHDVKEGLRSLFFQVVGSCGYYNIRTNFFRKVDVTRSNPCKGLECLEV